MPRNDALFSSVDLGGVLGELLGDAVGLVDAVPQDQFLNAPDDELVSHFVAELCVEPLALHEDLAQMDQHESTVDLSELPGRNHLRGQGPVRVPAVQVVVSMPYTGWPRLWYLTPNPHRTSFPRAVVMNAGQPNAGKLVIDLVHPADNDPAMFKAELDRELESVRWFIAAQSGQVARYNEDLVNRVRDAIVARRARIKKHSGLESLLGIPLKRRDGVPDAVPITMQRRLVRPLPPAPKSGFKAEPGIREADYEHILSVIRHEGRTFETTPSTYAVHGEEELRDIVLAHLNGHYQGDATGETFRAKGKTDIRIEDGDRAAFVAECKVWRGPKPLGEAIDQLLGYLTWRDCKTAVVVFNKDVKAFSGILESIPKTLTAHPNFRFSTHVAQDGEWQFTMTSREDEGRLVRVHVFAFNLCSS